MRFGFSFGVAVDRIDVERLAGYAHRSVLLYNVGQFMCEQSPSRQRP
jgi:hypothetical protein